MSSTKFGLKKIACVIYPNVVALDLIGPIEAFNYATLLLQEEFKRADIGYQIDLYASTKGPVQTMSTIAINANKTFDESLAGVNMILVPGMTFGNREFISDGVVEWIKANASQSERIVSVCSGALLLAYANLLEGHRVTTHWNHGEILRREFKNIVVNDSQIHCISGNVYSSAGVSAGIDLALAIIEEDYGKAVALKIAKRMVVFLKRPGDQNQFSELLSSQMKAKRFTELLDWIEKNLKNKITANQLADMCAMSTRNFSRSFTVDIGHSPMKYIQRRRLEWARVLLEETELPLTKVASESGFGSANSLSKVFKTVLRTSPNEYRKRFK